ncbi:MAG: hypothetical protein IJF71_05430 [Clostridia bacterium]|nr:hypothetical protein [Clostridia bacterium]
MPRKGFASVLKSALFSVLFTLIAILLLAAAVKLFSLGDGVILFVNQLIKAACILLGCTVGLKGEGLPLLGMAAGGLSVFTAYTLFSLLSQEPFFRIALLLELVFGLAVGFLSGIICKMCKKTA